MKSAGTPVGSAPAAQPGGDFFAATHYADWVRGSLHAMATRPNAIALYDSTISEPSRLLAELVAKALVIPSDAGGPRFGSRYVSVFANGNRFLVNALCARYGETPERLQTVTGVTGGLQLILRALVKPGERVLIENPGFKILSNLALEAGAVVDDLERPAPDFGVDPAQVAAQLTPDTRLVILTNPHNPTGTCLDPATLTAVARAAARVGALLVVDEVYGDFSRRPSAGLAAKLAPNIISLSSLTKVFGLFALKCGWMVADPDVLARIRARQPEGDVGVSKLAHAVAAHVLENADTFDRHWQAVMTATTPVLRRHADAMRLDGLIEGAVPASGCLYFPRIVGVADTWALTRHLWNQADLLVAPGDYFGLAGHVRLGYAGDAETLDKGLTRLHAGLRAWRNR
ncbi:pyridoxal phosphate-dependent aminotransferase [Nitrospirillum pindoramense]|uniref:Aspartate/methionine/tyrosine aminotransferase n=1 Tax=Nitrospirillum amazonense TaxID=28077 RepID=A0A560GZY6_9PROT|nr:pyridoxal phosphate-dependent aminotransferase [Nitrospirillum amazonense]TWB39617.1 aspartate/methionine/tyrosine aminotransferase [Nitrospirillum amazonense]